VQQKVEIGTLQVQHRWLCMRKGITWSQDRSVTQFLGFWRQPGS